MSPPLQKKIRKQESTLKEGTYTILNEISEKGDVITFSRSSKTTTIRHLHSIVRTAGPVKKIIVTEHKIIVEYIDKITTEYQSEYKA